jgi:hypothetical protein
VFARSRFNQDTNAWLAQIWAYDIDAGTERLITDFDGKLPATALTGPITLSPDRRWVAFSGHFKPAAFIYEAFVRLIWKVSVDGKTFVRLTPATDPRPSCSAAMPCTGFAQKTCEQGRCMPHGWIYAHEDPAWSPDSSVVLFTITEIYCYQFGCTSFGLPLGMTRGAISLAAFMDDRADSEIKVLARAADFDKCDTFGARLSRDGKQLAISYECGGAMSLLVSAADGSDPVSFDFGKLGDAEWAADGKTMYVSTLDGSTVSRLDLDSAKTTVVLSNADPKESVENFRISEDGRKLIFSSRNSETSAVNLLMLDLSSGDVRKLTSDRVSRL